MRLTSRLAASAVVIAASGLFFLVRLQNEKARQQRDLESSSRLLAETLREIVEPSLGHEPAGRLNGLVERFGNRGRLAGIAVFGAQNAVFLTGSLKPYLASPPKVVADCLRRNAAAASFERIAGRGFYITALPLHRDGALAGALATFHDTTYIDNRLARIWRNNFEQTIVQVGLFLLVLIALRRILD